MAVPSIAAPAQSHWVYPDPGGQLHYQTSEKGDRIMDFSFAGYMSGGVALPAGNIRRCDPAVDRVLQLIAGAFGVARVGAGDDDVASNRLEPLQRSPSA